MANTPPSRRHAAGRKRRHTNPTGQPESASLDHATVLKLLGTAEIADCKPLPWGSNYTFALALAANGGQVLAIYKPARGEAPLWDFPAGTLYRREYASYVLAELLGWHFIPPTVVRGGPYGVGTVQLYVDTNPHQYFPAFRERYEDEVRRIAAFDLLTNNADRKAGHFLLGRDGRVWGIDHGLTFHVRPKLRTVAWDLGGEDLPPAVVTDLTSLDTDLARQRETRAVLSDLLLPEEVEALFVRLRGLLARPRFPVLDRYRNVPFGFG